jgi:hypothetical protein
VGVGQRDAQTLDGQVQDILDAGRAGRTASKSHTLALTSVTARGARLREVLFAPDREIVDDHHWAPILAS